MIKTFTAIFLALFCASCGVASGDQIAFPGRVPAQRMERDRNTCTRLDSLSNRSVGFLSQISRECNVGLDQVLDPRTDLAVFDVARAYLDALHDFANAVAFLEAQGDAGKVSSDTGAYLIARQTGLIGARQDWRYETGRGPHPSTFPATRSYLSSN